MFSHLPGNGTLATFGMVLLHTLWQGALICTGTALVLEWQRYARATLRYGIYCFALLLLVASSMATFVWSTSSLRATSMGIVFTAEGTDGLVASAPAQDVVVARPATTVVFKTPVVIPNSTPEFSMKKFFDRCAFGMAMMWLVVVPLLLLRLLINYTYLRMVHLRDASTAPESMEKIAQRLCIRMGYRRTVKLLLSTRAAVPMVIGWIKPVVLLPAAFLAGVSPEQIEALLAHELAHMRRLDPFVNFLQCIAETVLFFNPAAWWLSRRIRIEREYCCDDLALAMGTNPTLYAESLLAVAETAINGSAYAMSSGGGMLLTRIKRVLGVDARPRGMVKTGLLGAVVVVALMLSVCTTYVLAQDQKPAVTTLKQTEVGKLPFPTDRSVGEIHIRKAGVNYSTSNWEKGHGIGWKLLCPAQGTVSIPEGMEVYLVLKDKNLDLLNNLFPDSIARLECNNLDLTEDNIAPIASLTGLKSLILGSNPELTDQGMEKLKSLQNIEWFHLIKTGVQKLTFVKYFRKLQKLEVNQTNIDDESMANLAAADLPDLVSLYIDGTKIGAQGFANLARIKSLKGLWLGKMELDDACLGYIAQSSSIEYIKAKDNNFNDTDLETLQTMKSLRVLHIPLTQVSDDGMVYVAAMPALEQIYMYGTKVTEACLPTLATSKTLWEVEASNTDIPYESLKAWRINNNFKRKSFPKPDAPQHSTNSRALKVGITLSDIQATGTHWMPDPYGFEMNGHRGQLIKLLKNANVDLYAVVEPNTEKLGELPQILASTGLTTKTVNSTDPVALSKLDVVCIWRAANILPETVTALQTAVKQGLGLVCNANMGSASPKLNDPAIMEFVGHSSQKYSWWGEGNLPFEVMSTHPILGDLKLGTKIEIKSYNGAFDPSGPPQGIPLIGPSTDCKIPFYPMYLRDYGKGHMVNNIFWDLEIPGIPAETFYMRCVNWAAGRPVDTKY